jgi:hypothetical protein
MAFVGALGAAAGMLAAKSLMKTPKSPQAANSEMVKQAPVSPEREAMEIAAVTEKNLLTMEETARKKVMTQVARGMGRQTVLTQPIDPNFMGSVQLANGKRAKINSLLGKTAWDL